MCVGWFEEWFLNLFDVVVDLRWLLKSIGLILVVWKGCSKDVLFVFVEEVSEEMVVVLGVCGESFCVGDF